MTPRPVVLLATAPDHSTAVSIANRLVDERLAACCNVIDGMTSIYRWQDVRVNATETLMIIKTAEDRVVALERRYVGLHPYDVPELILLGVATGNEPYLSWVIEASRPSADE